jgi:hypothetical protein
MCAIKERLRRPSAPYAWFTLPSSEAAGDAARGEVTRFDFQTALRSLPSERHLDFHSRFAP